MRLPFRLTQQLGEIYFIKSMSVQGNTAFIPIAISTISLIYFLTTSAKVPIHVTLPNHTFTLKIMVEIHFDKCIPKAGNHPLDSATKWDILIH
jgi:hypothetical protein